MGNRWLKIYLITSLLALVAVAADEAYWRQLGYRPTVVDDKSLWSVQRQRIDDNPNTFAVLGASRMQLGFNAQAFARLYPDWKLVNLTINAQYPIATLVDLAENTEFRGVILISLHAQALLPEFQSMQQPWVDYYHRDFGPGLWLNSQLAARKQMLMVSANPDLSITGRLAALLGHEGKPHITYVVFDLLRFGHADYKQVNAEYHLRRHEEEKMENQQLYEFLSPSPEDWLRGTGPLLQAIRTIQARGGTVILMRMPTTEGIWRVDKQYYPREDYWDRLTGQDGVRSFHFLDSPELASYALPDGSHLDFRDSANFTRDMLQALQERGLMPGSVVPGNSPRR